MGAALTFAPSMTYQEILKEISAGKFRPVYFLMGDEPYFIDKIISKIEKTALQEDQQSFNQTILYGLETDIRTVTAEARRYPMMAERVVIIVKEAQHLRKMDEALENYLKNPQKSTVLVFGYKNKKLDKRTKIYKALSNAGAVMESKKLYDNQVPQWIGQLLKSKGYGATPKALQLLADSLGTDLGRIENELQKLELVVEKGGTVDENAVEENIGISKDFNVFELQNALGKKDFVKAIKIQNYFAANPKDHPLVMTVGVLFTYFVKLMQVHTAKDKNPRALAGVLKVNPYFVGDYQNAAKNYNLKKLVRIVEYLRECDTKSKGIEAGNIPDHELLRELLFKIVYA